jgi:hypothetical protein
MFMDLNRPLKSTSHESTTQERNNERNSEEKQVARLLNVVAKKLAAKDRKSSPVRVAWHS